MSLVTSPLHSLLRPSSETHAYDSLLPRLSPATRQLLIDGLSGHPNPPALDGSRAREEIATDDVAWESARAQSALLLIRCAAARRRIPAA